MLWGNAFLMLGLLLGEGLLSPSRSAEGQQVTATDFRGRQIRLSAPAKRIVCLIESGLSGLYMLGAERQVVGISSNVYQEGVFPYYAAMDERIKNKLLPTPGNWDFVNLESVVALQPDLVIIWSHQKESIQALEEKGIPVFGVFIERFADVHRELRALGTLTGTSLRAEELIHLAEERLAIIRQRIAGVAERKRTRVYYMWAQGELETSGKNSTVDELIELAGGENVAGVIDQEHWVVNMENVLLWNPEVVVMWHNTRRDPADVLALPRWQAVAAIRNRRVHEFPDVFSCDLWTLKYLFAVELVAHWCYPRSFETFDLEEERKGLFSALYGDKLPVASLPPLTPEGGARP